MRHFRPFGYVDAVYLGSSADQVLREAILGSHQVLRSGNRRIVLLNLDQMQRLLLVTFVFLLLPAAYVILSNLS
jgi:hypothetical protein